jgi:hypothetical protein
VVEPGDSAAAAGPQDKAVTVEGVIIMASWVLVGGIVGVVVMAWCWDLIRRR